MTADEGRPDIVTAVLRRHDQVLLCHRSPQRAWYPDVWDFPGGHVEAGKAPEDALVRELREELGISVPRPSHGPVAVVATAGFRMQVWLVEAWAGHVSNNAPEEHDRVMWAGLDRIGDLDLAHSDYLPLLTELLTVPDHGLSPPPD